MSSSSTIFFASFAMAAVPFLAKAIIGCSPEAKHVEAEVGYLSQQQRCIEQYIDREHIDTCRERVRAEWALDAGKDGAR